MRSIPPGRLARRLVGAFLTLLAGFVASPSRSEAACDRHLLPVSTQDGAIRSLYPELLGAMEAASADAPIGMPVPYQPQPCSGPSCSKDPAAPSAPMVSLDRVESHWAALSTAPAIPTPGASLLLPEPDDLLPILAVTSIFHPPRRAS